MTLSDSNLQIPPKLASIDADAISHKALLIARADEYSRSVAIARLLYALEISGQVLTAESLLETPHV